MTVPPSLPPPGTVDIEHLPDRPSWDCLSCGKPWPCDPAREELWAALDRIALAMYAWNRLEEAALDIPGGPPGDLFKRFISWTRGPGDR